jgi:hypothetical protein
MAFLWSNVSAAVRRAALTRAGPTRNGTRYHFLTIWKTQTNN